MKQTKNLIYKAGLFFTLPMLALHLCACNEIHDPSNDKVKILYEDVADISLFMRDSTSQVAQIPLLLNKQIEQLTVMRCEGENVNQDAIKYTCALDSSYKNCYCYIITLDIDPSRITQSDGDVVINNLQIVLEDEQVDYHFGQLELLNTVALNTDDSIEYRGCGTGYETLTTIDCAVTALEPVLITGIRSSNEVKFENESQYLGNLSKGSILDCKLTIETDSLTKLYYCFDLCVDYQTNGKDNVFYFNMIPVQTSIKNRLSFFINQQEGA